MRFDCTVFRVFTDLSSVQTFQCLSITTLQTKYSASEKLSNHYYMVKYNDLVNPFTNFKILNQIDHQSSSKNYEKITTATFCGPGTHF